MADFDCSGSSSQLVINLDALRANYLAVRAHVSSSDCGAVVKADAYGLGARRVAMALYDEGCRMFFVAQLCEALDLHASLPLDCAIVILNGLDPGGEEICADLGFMPVLNSRSQIQRWREAARRRKTALPAALQIETGMSRLGLLAADLREMAHDVSFPGDVDLRLIMSHLACADEPDSSVNTAQLDRFCELARLFPTVPRSIANSSGTALASSYHLEVVRPGITLYGVPPRHRCLGISPVVTLKARVLQIRELQAGSGVGYGLAYRTPGPRRLATVAMGYADGWPRSLSHVGAAWYGNIRLPIVGRVSMDSMTVDISAAPRGAIREDDFVELIGPRQTLDDVAADAGTIAYEILTRIGPRHARFYIDRDASASLTPGAAI